MTYDPLASLRSVRFNFIKIFISRTAQTAGRKFLDVVEDAITSPHAPAVRERLLEVLGAAVYLTAEKGE